MASWVVEYGHAMASAAAFAAVSEAARVRASTEAGLVTVGSLTTVRPATTTRVAEVTSMLVVDVAVAEGAILAMLVAVVKSPLLGPFRVTSPTPLTALLHYGRAVSDRPRWPPLP